MSGTQKSCYNKYTSETEVRSRQSCVYTANGEMICGFAGDPVDIILGKSCTNDQKSLEPKYPSCKTCGM